MRINIFGGPGVGKTTQALDIAYQLRTRGFQIEYVDEYVKGWAYDGRKPTPIDEIYIAGNQFYREVRILENGTPHIITDSPVWFASLYSRTYGGDDEVAAVIDAQVDFLDKRFPYVNIFIERDESIFTDKNRVHTLEESKKVDVIMKEALFKKYGKENLLILDPRNEQSKKEVLEKVIKLIS